MNDAVSATFAFNLKLCPIYYKNFMIMCLCPIYYNNFMIMSLVKVNVKVVKCPATFIGRVHWWSAVAECSGRV